MKHYAFLLLLLFASLSCATVREAVDVASGETPIEDASPEAGAVVEGVGKVLEEGADPKNWTLEGILLALGTAGLYAYSRYRKRRNANG